MTGSRPCRVTLVTHDASLSGAPMVALLTARHLTEQGHRVTVVSRRNGPLLADFRAVTTTCRDLLFRVRPRLWLHPRLSEVAWRVDMAAAVLTLVRHRPDLVYVNSTAAGIYVRAAQWLGLPVVLHVHESEENTSELLDRARVDDLDGVDLIACSPSVHAHLVARTERPESTVHLVPSVPDQERVFSLASAQPFAQPPERRGGLLVGAAGRVGHRKGTDLWLQVAERVRLDPRTSGVEFVWVGPLGDPPHPSNSRGVVFTGPQENPYPTMSHFDILTLPSRDDPFPLVVIEAMLLGKPVVAFDVGSVSAQVGAGGIIVPPEDVDAFTAAVSRLLLDGEERVRLGRVARARAEELFSSDAFGTRLRGALADPLTRAGGPDASAGRSRSGRPFA